jgi:hypothetical protein
MARNTDILLNYLLHFLSLCNLKQLQKVSSGIKTLEGGKFCSRSQRSEQSFSGYLIHFLSIHNILITTWNVVQGRCRISYFCLLFVGNSINRSIKYTTWTGIWEKTKKIGSAKIYMTNYVTSRWLRSRGCASVNIRKNDINKAVRYARAGKIL